jgi:hypothetical protein
MEITCQKIDGKYLLEVEGKIEREREKKLSRNFE